MISFYSGTPGSGKSLHVARTIYTRLRVAKINVIATFPIRMSMVNNNGKIKTGEFRCIHYSNITPAFLIDYAREHHKHGKEGQTLVVIDECQIIFNPRDVDKKDRRAWIDFFTQHRKLGFDFILISPNDKLIDRQIRALFEYEVRHLKANNLGLIGMLLPFPMFVARTYWYSIKEFMSSEFFFYRKKWSNLYDSYLFFDESVHSIEECEVINPQEDKKKDIKTLLFDSK